MKFVIIILFAFVISIAHAAQNMAPMLSLEDLMDLSVETASKKKEKLSQAPSNISVITADEIKRRGYRGLSDIYKDLPGVVVFSAEPSEGASVAIRGIRSITKFKLLFDGMQINPRAASEYFSGVNRYPVERIAQVEFILGPYSSTYGRDSYTGVINVISKKGGDINGFEAKLGYAVPYNEKKAELIYGKKFENLEVLLSLYLNDADGRDLPEEYPGLYSEEARRASRTSSGQGSFDPNAPTEFTQPYGNQDLYVRLKYKEKTKFDLSYNSMIAPKIGVDLHPDAYYSNEDTFAHEKSINSRLSHDYKFGNFNMTTEIVQQKWTVFQRNGYLDNKTKIYREESDAVKIEQRARLQFSKNHEFAISSSYEEIDHKFPIPSDRIENAPEPDWEEDEMAMEYYTNFSFQDEWQSDDEKYKVVSGLFLDTSNIYDSVLLPRLAVIYNQNKSSTFKFLYSEGYVTPSTEARIDIVVALPSDSVKGSNELTPEKVTHYEINHLFNKDNQYFFTTAIFYDEVKDTIVQVTSNDVGPLYGNTFVNKGSKTVYGAEFTMKAKHNSWISSWFSYGYAKGTKYGVDSTGANEITDHLAPSAEHHYKLGVNFLLDKNKYNLNIHQLYVASTNIPDSANRGSQPAKVDEKTSAFNIVDLNLNTTENWSKKWGFGIVINNLFDKKGYTAPIDTSIFRVEQPIPRRSFTTTMNYKFD